MGAYCNVDFVALDRSAGVLSDEHAVALDEYAAAERNDGRVNCDRAAFGQGGAGSGQCQIVAVAFNARIVEGQFIIAKRSGICLDGIACQIRCGVSYRTGGGCTCDQLVVSGLGCSGLDLGFLLSCFFSGLFGSLSLSLLSSFLLRLLGSILLCLECGSLCLHHSLLCIGDFGRGEHRADRMVQSGREYRSRLLQCSSAEGCHRAYREGCREEHGSMLTQRNRHLCYAPKSQVKTQREHFPRHRKNRCCFLGCYCFVYVLFPNCNQSYCILSDLSNGFIEFCAHLTEFVVGFR